VNEKAPPTPPQDAALDAALNRDYEHGFVTQIESELAPKGLNEDIIRLISAKKSEPEWLLEWRLAAYGAGSP
jgi:Fe-S cluster assembly protein SufB